MNNKLVNNKAHFAPERFDENDEDEEKVDIWGFGILIYELLT